MLGGYLPAQLPTLEIKLNHTLMRDFNPTGSSYVCTLLKIIDIHNTIVWCLLYYQLPTLFNVNSIKNTYENTSII